jgi:hypothetical protein
MTDTTTTCDWCEREFEPQPHNFVESGFSVAPEEGDEWKNDGDMPHNDEPPTPEQIAAMKREMQLSDEQVQQLINTGHVDTGYSCICDECLGGCGDEQDEEDAE